jgi:hypothetical protein
VQIVHSSRRGSREIEHIGSAHSPAGVEVLRAAARQRLHAHQDAFDFGDGRPEGQALPITSTQSKHLWDALGWAYHRLGLDVATGGDEVFRQLVLAQITVGLLTDVRGFPLQVHTFDGNTAETNTIVPVIQAFAIAHGLPEVTVVADAG